MSDTKTRTVKQIADELGYSRHGIEKMMATLAIEPKTYPGTVVRFLSAKQVQQIRKLALSRAAGMEGGKA